MYDNELWAKDIARYKKQKPAPDSSLWRINSTKELKKELRKSSVDLLGNNY